MSVEMVLGPYPCMTVTAECARKILNLDSSIKACMENNLLVPINTHKSLKKMVKKDGDILVVYICDLLVHMRDNGSQGVIIFDIKN